MINECVSIATSFMVLGAGLECIVILVGYVLSSVYNLMKAR